LQEDGKKIIILSVVFIYVSLFWLLKKKWFWKDKEAYKEWKKSK